LVFRLEKGLSFRVGVVLFVLGGAFLFDVLTTIIVTGEADRYVTFVLSCAGFIAIGVGLRLILRNDWQGETK